MFLGGRDASEPDGVSGNVDSVGAHARHLRIVHSDKPGAAFPPFSLGRLEGLFESLEGLRFSVSGSPVAGSPAPTSDSSDSAQGLGGPSGAGLGATSDEDLCVSVLLVERVRRSLDALSVVLVGELDARDVTNEAHGMRTGPWMAREAELASGAARSQVNVAGKLRTHLPAAKAALEEGRVGFQHARVLADAASPRIIGEFNRFIPDLVELVPLMSFEHWKRKVAEVADLLDEDGGHTPGDDITDNTLTLSPSWHGVLGVNGQLCGDNAVTVSHALEARADEIFHRMRSDSELTGDLRVPPRKTLLALALVELVREALGKDKGSTSAPKTEAALVINAADPDMVTDTNGTPIGNTGRSTFMCDPVFKPVVMDLEGMVLDLGRDQRLASKALHDALAHRDGGCVWPGCANPSAWCDAHHTDHWRNGGATDRENLA